MSRVGVVGVGNTPFKARHIDKTFQRLSYESVKQALENAGACLLYTSPSPRD